MPVEILMPALSPTMTEGTLAKWLKSEGDSISAGDAIAEIETDKATMEVEAVEEGTIGKILVEAGTEGVAVNQVIAILLEEGESADDIDVDAAKADAPASPPAEDSGKEEKKEEPKKESKREEKGEETKSEEKAPAAASQEKSSGDGERIFASPLARRMAKQAGLDLAKLKGSGPHGRIVKADIDAALEGGKGKEAAAPAAASSGAPAAPEKAAAAGPTA